MGCQSTRCVKPECPNKVPACQLINGLCPSCYAKRVQEQKEYEAQLLAQQQNKQ